MKGQRYERDGRGALTCNGHLDSRLDALALLEAQLEGRLAEMNNLLTEASEADLRVISAALVSVASLAVRKAHRNPPAVLRTFRLGIIENS
jgi:hypothetical protein